jgi:hypothetical protein
MSQSNIDRPLAQDPSGTLHAGVDLALEKNVVVVVNEQAQRLDNSRGVDRMIGMQLKSKIAQLSPDDLGPGACLHAGHANRQS